MERRLARYARIGWHGRYWYTQLRRHATRRYGRLADRWLICFALTSPNCTVASNRRLADKALRQWTDRHRFAGYLPSVARDLERARRAIWTKRPIRVAGPKVSAFLRACRGDRSAVVIDRWMGRAIGLKDIPRGATWIALRDTIRTLARELYIAPRTLQAAIWTGIRKEQTR